MSRILFLSRWLPFPADNGSKVRISNLLRSLSQAHEVTLLSFADSVEAKTPALNALCADVQLVPWQAFNPHSKSARLGFFNATPRSIFASHSPEMAARVQEALAAQKFDLVIASQTTMAGYVPAQSPVPALFEEAELGVYYDELVRPNSAWRRLRYAPTWIKHCRYLESLLCRFCACTVVSGHERWLLKKHVGGDCPVHVIPNFVALDEYGTTRKIVKPNTLIFTGSFRYFPNHDAMVWFLQNVYSHIREQAPHVRLNITGDHANLPLPNLQGVALQGVVPDIRSAIASASISLAPIRFGGGTRLKILEAMALHTPVVATSKGAEGLDVRDGEQLLLGDTPQEFAAQVLRLLDDPALCQRLAGDAFQLMRSTYDTTVVLPRFMNLVASLTRH